MKRHHVIIRLGKEDKFTVKPADKSAVVSLVPAAGNMDDWEFGLDNLLGAARCRKLSPPEVAFDLALLAVTVMGADTRISRSEYSQDGWTREISLYLPVNDPKTWGKQSAHLARMLNFLTGDRWNLFFRARPKKFALAVAPPDEFEFSNYSCVSLLSGGLDSFIGALDLLAEGERPLFVSHYWHGITNHYQKAVVAALEAEYPKASAFDSALIHSGFRHNTIKGGGVEDTQRSRSFLFFSLAVFFASCLKKKVKVMVPENGLIALNVPLDPLRVGALSTRTAHPFYLSRWNELLVALGLDVQLYNPYATQTKGQMVKGCQNQKALKKYVTKTMSCSSPEKARWKKLSPRHCGICLPCVIRRASLVAGHGNDPTVYTTDLGGKLTCTQAEGEHIRSFQVALADLKARPDSARFSIRKPGPLIDVGDQIDNYEKVYRTGMKEIETLLAGTQTVP
jgi:7-cyano-7-deazaguanine synthase in queuosine biosynthesis